MEAVAPYNRDEDGEPLDRCFICAVPFKLGDRVLPDVSGECGHAACYGPDRESYVKDLETGEPLGPDDPIPAGHLWEPDLTRHEREVLAAIQDKAGSEYSLSFKAIEKRTALSRKAVRTACRSLAGKGLLHFSSGLMTEDGEVAGSGYGCTDDGWTLARQWLDAAIARIPQLTTAQVAFLRFHDLIPAPHAWAWNGNSPATATVLTARRYLLGRSGEEEACAIGREDLAGLDGFWSMPLQLLNEAGRRAVRERAD